MINNTKRMLSQDDLVLEAAIATRAKWRVVAGSILIIIGMTAVFASFFPLLAKSALPLLWVEFANKNGWNDQMQEIGMLLLANGRIEIYPLWVSYIGMTVGAIFAWLGISMIISREDPKVFGRLLSKGYWLQFYLLRPEQKRTKVQYQPLKKTAAQEIKKHKA